MKTLRFNQMLCVATALLSMTCFSCSEDETTSASDPGETSVQMPTAEELGMEWVVRSVSTTYNYPMGNSASLRLSLDWEDGRVRGIENWNSGSVPQTVNYGIDWDPIGFAYSYYNDSTSHREWRLDSFTLNGQGLAVAYSLHDDFQQGVPGPAWDGGYDAAITYNDAGMIGSISNTSEYVWDMGARTVKNEVKIFLYWTGERLDSIVETDEMVETYSDGTKRESRYNDTYRYEYAEPAWENSGTFTYFLTNMAACLNYSGLVGKAPAYVPERITHEAVMESGGYETTSQETYECEQPTYDSKGRVTSVAFSIIDQWGQTAVTERFEYLD